MKIINGKKLAAIREKKLKLKIAKLGVRPKVVSILIGGDPPSILYTNMKHKKAADVGIDFEPLRLSEKTPFEQVVKKVEELNQDKSIEGIMMQLPLPKEFLNGHDPKELIMKISPKKDFDGLTGKGIFLPAVVRAVFSILEDEKVVVKNKKVAVLGRSDLIGKPVAREMRKLGARVFVIHKETKNPKKITQAVDIIVAATGVPELLKGDWVSRGVVVIDVGTQKVNDKLVGDVEFDTVSKKASKITPVPGGVGPMTVISLMENVLNNYDKKN